MGRIRDIGHDGGNVYRWQTLANFVNSNGFTKGAELGIHDGVNYRFLIQNCPNLHMIGVDLYEAQPDNNGPEKWTPGEHGHAWDHNSYYQNMLKFSSHFPNRTKIVKDYTTNACNEVEDGSLDFIFIDADHGYEGCLRDIKAWDSKVREGGIVFGHDIHFPTVQRAVTEFYGENSWFVEDDFIWWIQK